MTAGNSALLMPVLHLKLQPKAGHGDSCLQSQDLGDPLRQENFCEFNFKLGYMGASRLSWDSSETLSQIMNKMKIKTVGW